MDKKIVLVARDAAPSGCFSRLAPILRERGFDILLFIGEGKPLAQSRDEIVRAAESANLVLLGMSSSLDLATPEIVAAQVAKRANVPFGFYGDVPRCWARARPGAWFEAFAASASFYLGVTEADAEMARGVFATARLIGTGNPLREEMAFPRFTREYIREALGIGSNEKLVLVPGGKFAAGNIASWVVIIDALARLQTHSRQRSQLVLATHPGDRTPSAVDAATQKEMRLYEEMISCSPVPTRIVPKQEFTTSEMVPGADIIIEFGSSIGIEGAYQGVPVVSLGFEILFRRLEEASGTKELESVTDGLSELVVGDVSSLVSALRRFFTVEGFAPMRARQQELCPKPTERGAALRKIADAIAVMM